MAVNIADDELFTRAVSGYKEAFWSQHQHLSESQRGELWAQRLSQFLTTTATSTATSSSAMPGEPKTDGKPASSGATNGTKHQLSDVPRTIPGVTHAAKRRAIVCFRSLFHVLVFSCCLYNIPSHRSLFAHSKVDFSTLT